MLLAEGLSRATELPSSGLEWGGGEGGCREGGRSVSLRLGLQNGQAWEVLLGLGPWEQGQAHGGERAGVGGQQQGQR